MCKNPKRDGEKSWISTNIAVLQLFLQMTKSRQEIAGIPSDNKQNELAEREILLMV